MGSAEGPASCCMTKLILFSNSTRSSPHRLCWIIGIKYLEKWRLTETFQWERGGAVIFPSLGKNPIPVLPGLVDGYPRSLIRCDNAAAGLWRYVRSMPSPGFRLQGLCAVWESGLLVWMRECTGQVGISICCECWDTIKPQGKGWTRGQRFKVRERRLKGVLRGKFIFAQSSSV